MIRALSPRARTRESSRLHPLNMAEAPSGGKRPPRQQPYKPDSVPRLLGTGGCPPIAPRRRAPLPSSLLDSHLSVAGRCRPAHAANPKARASSPQTPPYSALHRVGLAWPPCHHGAGALLPHHFTVATGQTGVLCNFCGAFPGVSPAGRYPAPCSSVSGLSSKTRSTRTPAAIQAAARV